MEVQQTDLFEPRRLARRNGPATSSAAAARVREFAGGHHGQILAALKEHPGGLTAHEIAAYCQIDAHQVGKRINELEKAGQIEAVVYGFDKILTRKTPSGRNARVWRLA